MKYNNKIIIISMGIEKAFDNIRHPFLVFSQDPMLREHKESLLEQGPPLELNVNHHRHPCQNQEQEKHTED